MGKRRQTDGSRELFQRVSGPAQGGGRRGCLQLLVRPARARGDRRRPRASLGAHPLPLLLDPVQLCRQDPRGLPGRDHGDRAPPFHRAGQRPGPADARKPSTEPRASPSTEPAPGNVPADPRDLARRAAMRSRAARSIRKMTFDTFVAGAPNEMALGVAKQVAHAALNNAVTLQPGLHPFDRGPRQVAPAQRHRLGGGRGGSEPQHRLSDRRPLHVPLHHRGAAPVGARLQGMAAPRRPAADRRHAVPPGQVGHRVRPHARHAADRRQAGGGRRRRAAARSRNARRAGALAALGRPRRADHRLRLDLRRAIVDEARRAGAATRLPASTSRRR